MGGGEEDQVARQLDEALAALARREAALRLCLGQTLEVLSRGGVFALGFSSVAAYAIERCDRSGRWAEGARCLARRVEALPELRHAVAAGRTSWSMAELIARVAQPGDEAYWLESAKTRTVRQMRVLVAKALAVRREAQRLGDTSPASFDAALQVAADLVTAADETRTLEKREEYDAVDESRSADEEDDDVCTLTCTVPQEDAWLFEATRLLLGQLGVKEPNAQCEALLAEGQGTLLGEVPDLGLDPDRWQGVDVAQQRWVRELALWRFEAEATCEERFVRSLSGSRNQPQKAPKVDRSDVGRESRSQPGSAVRSRFGAQIEVPAAAAKGMASLERSTLKMLDARVRYLSRALAQHELDVARMVLQFHRANGWRALGYATETQYARERLGSSPSAQRGRRSLALRLERLPKVASALGAGQIGVEAALQVVRVATASTQAAWVERARQRTVKHLREEVAAALIAVRFSGEADCEPPTDEEIAAFQRLEQAVVSGRVCSGEVVPPAASVCQERGVTTAQGRLVEPTSEARRAWCVMLASLAGWLKHGLQLSAASSRSAPKARPVKGSGRCANGQQKAGLVTLRLRMLRSTYTWWRGLETQARRWLPFGMSWLRYLCLSMWEAWRHTFGAKVAYAQIYARDCHRCMSPVCTRRDVTPHHIRFRSAGGGEDPQNIGSLCTWCHLFGVHGGRIRATGTASHIRWELGPVGSPCLVVDGRERLAA